MFPVELVLAPKLRNAPSSDVDVAATLAAGELVFQAGDLRPQPGVRPGQGRYCALSSTCRTSLRLCGLGFRQLDGWG
jgi:hypothetical protein